MISIHDSDDEDVSGEMRPHVSLSPSSEDETIAATRKLCQLSEGALPSPSRPRFAPKGDGSFFAAQSDLISLAGRMRSAGCRLHLLLPQPRRNPTPRLRWRVPRFVSCFIFLENLLRSIRSLISTSSHVMEAFNEYIVVMEDHVVASQNDEQIKSSGSEIKRISKELEATKREGKKYAEQIAALTEDWRSICLENKALTTQVVAQR